MGYCFMHIGKIKTFGELQAHYVHNYREVEVSNADPNKEFENEELVMMPVRQGRKMSYGDMVKERLESLPYYKNHKLRTNQVLALEVVTTFSREDDIDLEKWKEENVKWLQKTFNVAMDRKDNVISVMYHGDEPGNVHCHAVIIPVDEKGHFNAKRFVDGARALSDMQTDYASSMAQFGLERGIEGSSAKHEDIRRYYADLNQSIKSIPVPLEHESAHEFRERAIEELGTARAANLREIRTAQRRGQQSIDKSRQKFRTEMKAEREEFNEEIELERKATNLEIEGKKAAANKELKASKEKLDAMNENIGIAQDDLLALQQEVDEYEERKKKLNIERLRKLEEAERFKNDFDYGMEIMEERFPDVAENMRDYMQLMMECVDEERAQDEAYEEALLSQELYDELYGNIENEGIDDI